MKSTRKFGFGLAALAAMFGAVVAGGGSALAQTVPTGATIDGSGPPRIECKWELPDMNSAVPGIQYSNPAHVHDDDMGVNPGSPCDVHHTAAGVSDGPSTMADNVHHMIQVKANTYDLPEQRRIQLWVAADHPNGISNISDVFWDVYHTDGSFKLQVHGTRVPTGECAQGGLADGTMFEAATHTGQLTSAAVSDPNYGIVAKCQESEKALYYAEFPLSKEQMCGEYRIRATAVSTTGATTSLNNYIDVICQYYLAIDFTTVDFGTVTPGLVKVHSGDLLTTTPNAPTIVNGQNSGMAIKVQFSTMTGANWHKVIDQFDACFGRSAATILCIDPIFAPTTVADFGTAPAQVLCADEPGKLDLSIHPPSTIPADTYAGNVTVIAYSVPGECKGAAHVVPGT